MPMQPSKRPEGGGDNLPEGHYEFFILSAVDKKTKDGSKQMTSLECQVVAPKEFAKRHHWINAVDVVNNPFSYDTYNDLCFACGFQGWQNNPAALKGKRFQGDVMHRTVKDKNGNVTGSFVDTKNIRAIGAPAAPPVQSEQASRDEYSQRAAAQKETAPVGNPIEPGGDDQQIPF